MILKFHKITSIKQGDPWVRNTEFQLPARCKTLIINLNNIIYTNEPSMTIFSQNTMNVTSDNY